MSTPAVVFLLHRQQPLTVDPAAALERPDAEVVVLSAPGGGGPFREDVPETGVDVREVAPQDWETVIRQLAGGRTFDIATNDEYALLDCQRLRNSLGLPSRHPSTLIGYLDKVVMKRRLSAADVSTARFTELATVVVDPAAARRLLGDLGTPVVVKPRQEANSRGVDVLRTADDIVAWQHRRAGEPGWHVEEFLAGEQYHVNALVRGGELTPVQVGRYLGPLLDLPRGRRLGAVSLPADDPLVPAAHALNERVVAALGGGDFVVHTEFVRRADGRLTVVEVAARAPGALVSEVSALTCGVQLEQANLRLQVGLEPATPKATGLHAGWVWVPVMPGETFTRQPPLTSEARIHIRSAARTPYPGRTGTIGASVLLWNADRDLLERDIQQAGAWRWTS
ncbi:acetyl-CoA carboxylase biotin carboxylase subunit family protein [Actinoplanes sp. N902-109]|uniref:ATP-grasp domain-containing protein n=1 Tax=Actinoplanes sp. (strain N902-109) TaxID=649831 RepID=UPI00059F544A|nr:hypothetical protein [Actinoplanes sp. N902-109]